MKSTARIDIHQHFLPPEFVVALERHGMGGWAPQAWSAEGAIAMMDTQEIATGVLSLSTPGPHLGDDAEARLLSRKINESLAELVKGRPDRFGMFACVPLPDIEGAIDAIAHAYDELATDGVVLLTNTQGTYLGDAVLEPVMAELNRRHAVVLVHPAPLPAPPVEGVHPSMVDFLLDTTRAAVNLALKGVMRRYPNIRFILSHAGGFLPYAAYRVSQAVRLVDASQDPADLLECLSNFYFDTAISASPTVLPSLLALTGSGRVLFGSDAPYITPALINYFTGNLDSYEGLDDVAHQAINRGNAEILLPRLASKG